MCKQHKIQESIPIAVRKKSIVFDGSHGSEFVAVDFCNATWSFVPDQENPATDTCGDLAENRKCEARTYIFLHLVRKKKPWVW